MLEGTETNIYLAWDLPAGSLGAGFGNNVNEHTATVTGPGPNSTTTVFTLARVVSVGNSEIMWSREAEVALAVEFECLKNNVGQFGTLVIS